MYILPKDLQEETNVLDVIPYVFDVDVIKDCSSLRNEIADVFSVISRDNGTGTYFTSIEKVRMVALVVQLNPEVIKNFFFHIFEFTVYSHRQRFIEAIWTRNEYSRLHSKLFMSV